MTTATERPQSKKRGRPKKLTEKQTIFVNYVKSGVKPTEAARQMGYKSPHVSAYFLNHNQLARKVILDYQDNAILKGADCVINYLVSVVGDTRVGDAARFKNAEIILRSQRDIANRLSNDSIDSSNLRNMSLDQLDRVVSALTGKLTDAGRPLIDIDRTEDVSADRSL